MNEPIILLSAVSTLGILGFGFLLGLKHATEADHLAAVSTIVTQGKGFLRSAGIGAIWGLGHTISLFVAGIFVLVLNFEISPQTETMLEFGVGIMLTLLGLNVIRKLFQGEKAHFHEHAHAGHSHVHPHVHPHQHDEEHVHPHLHEDEHVHEKKSGFSPRALIVGMIHGLAGSAALMLLVIPVIDSRAVGMLYIAIFGIGSIAGMAIMTFIVGLPFQIPAIRYSRFNNVLQAIAGLISVGLGLWIVYEKGFSA